MAREVVVLGICDMTGQKMPESEMHMGVKFGWGKEHFAIDLSPEAFKELEEFLLPYMESAQPVEDPRAGRSYTKPKQAGRDPKHACPYCPFVAMSTMGLKKHVTQQKGKGKHPREGTAWVPGADGTERPVETTAVKPSDMPKQRPKS